MRWFPIVVLIFGSTACNGKDGKSGDDTGGTGPTPVTVEIGSEAEVAAAEVSLSQDVIESHRVVNTLLSAARLVVAEAAVRDRLDMDNGGARDHHCWTVPAVPQSVFTIDYYGCTSMIDTTGAVVVNDTPLGPVIFQFMSLQISDRTVVGTLALDEEGADPLRWFAYDAIPETPSRDNRAPIGITIDDEITAVTWDGGAALKSFTDEWQLWGVAQLQDAQSNTATVNAGGTDPVALMTAVDPPGAPTSGFDYADCRCPTSGEVAYDMTLHVSEISVDIDALKTSDDGVDDPEIELVVDRTVTGPAVVSTVACGEYDTSFTAEDLVLTIDSQTVANAIRERCDSLVIDDPARCDALNAATASIDAFTFTMPAAQLEASLDLAVATYFDGPWCKY